MFEQYSQLVATKFPDIKIVGENYPPAQWKVYLTQFISTLKLLVIGIKKLLTHRKIIIIK